MEKTQNFQGPPLCRQLLLGVRQLVQDLGKRAASEKWKRILLVSSHFSVDDVWSKKKRRRSFGASGGFKRNKRKIFGEPQTECVAIFYPRTTPVLVVVVESDRNMMRRGDELKFFSELAKAEY